jgi:hypothetical protein
VQGSDLAVVVDSVLVSEVDWKNDLWGSNHDGAVGEDMGGAVDG